MDHDRCFELLSARLDGPLTGGEERELEDHLRTCPQCRALAEQLEQLHAGFAGLEELEAPAGFTGRVMERVREKRRPIPLFRRPQFRAVAGLAACAAICIGIYGTGRWGGQDLSDKTLVTEQQVQQSDTSISAYGVLPGEEDGSESAGNTVASAQAPAPQNDEMEVATGDSVATQGKETVPDAGSSSAGQGSGSVTDGSDSAASNGTDPAAPRLQASAFGADEDAEITLTVSRLPEGAQALLGTDAATSYSVETGQETIILSSLEQLEEIERLAREQGITASRFNGESGTGIFLLVVAGA